MSTVSVDREAAADHFYCTVPDGYPGPDFDHQENHDDDNDQH